MSPLALFLLGTVLGMAYLFGFQKLKLFEICYLVGIAVFFLFIFSYKNANQKKDVEEKWKK